MSFQDIIKSSVLDGFLGTDIPTTKIALTLSITFIISIYIFFIYRLINKTSLYDKNFHIGMSIIAVITAGIIIAMQSSIVISLGMVGALSIVRFRTAIKDTLDLLFLFWSIGEGIICGAGLFEIAIIVALMVTVGLFILEYLPGAKKPYLLIVNSNNTHSEEEIKKIIEEHSTKYSIKSRNIKKNGLDIIVEVTTKNELALLNELAKLESIVNASLLTHEGEVRFH